MGAGGAGNASTNATTFSVDPESLATFMAQGDNATTYASAYNPTGKYGQVGSNYYNPNQAINPANQTGTAALLTAYNAWMTSQNQTALNWNNYSTAVNANEGGEGDNTITSGAAVGQRQQLLGALATPNATTPTPGLSAMGAVANKMGVMPK